MRPSADALWVSPRQALDKKNPRSHDGHLMPNHEAAGQGGQKRACYSSVLGSLGAKPSSRVRMRMNSSPVMVSFFCR